MSATVGAGGGTIKIDKESLQTARNEFKKAADKYGETTRNVIDKAREQLDNCESEFAEAAKTMLDQLRDRVNAKTDKDLKKLIESFDQVIKNYEKSDQEGAQEISNGGISNS